MVPACGESDTGTGTTTASNVVSMVVQVAGDRNPLLESARYGLISVAVFAANAASQPADGAEESNFGRLCSLLLSDRHLARGAGFQHVGPDQIRLVPD
jgi:hypothetical protein